MLSVLHGFSEIWDAYFNFCLYRLIRYVSGLCGHNTTMVELFRKCRFQTPYTYECHLRILVPTYSIMQSSHVFNILNLFIYVEASMTDCFDWNHCRVKRNNCYTTFIFRRDWAWRNCYYFLKGVGMSDMVIVHSCDNEQNNISIIWKYTFLVKGS